MLTQDHPRAHPRDIAYAVRLPAAETDQARFWRMLDHRHEQLTELCQSWLGSGRADAELLEEIMSVGALRAVERLRTRSRPVRNMFPWYARLLHDLCRERLSDRRRVVPLDELDELEQTLTRSALAPMPIETPEHRVHRGELGRSLTRAVNTLSPKLRAAFILRFVEELPYREISIRLAISEPSARKRIQKARQRLRRDLDAALYSRSTRLSQQPYH